MEQNEKSRRKGKILTVDEKRKTKKKHKGVATIT
jgi:hypothetical protein